MKAMMIHSHCRSDQYDYKLEFVLAENVENIQQALKETRALVTLFQECINASEISK